MMMPLLPQQIVPVDHRQAELTARLLAGRTDEIEAYFLALRAEVDATLSVRLPVAAGKAYPYGRCEEITREVHARLLPRLRAPQAPVEQALHDFVAQGGAARTVWGVLREQYFQNAFQFGALYVDVSNDTVFVTKPKVEILPIESAGLVSVRDLAHFRQTAERYWGAAVYANHRLPTLAPLLPVITASPGRLLPGLQSACDYMIDFMCHDRFQQAEAWLADGPAPPDDMVLAGAPADLLPWTGDPRAEAVEACRRARTAGCHANRDWRTARVMDYLRSVGQGSAGLAAAG
jgi:hypothetical protein